MKPRVAFTVRIYTVLYTLIIASLLIYIFVSTEGYFPDYMGSLRDFAGEWDLPSGERVSIDHILSGGREDEVVLKKKIPGGIAESDSVCFESINLDLEVFVDERQVYTFYGRENLTGWGYGKAFHEVSLSRTDGGSIMTIRYRGSGSGYGQIRDVCLGTSQDFFRRCMLQRLFPASISAVIAFLGLFMTLIFLCIPDKDNLPFDFPALGVASMICGSWLLVDTDLPLLLTGHLYLWRVFSRTVLIFAVYPCVSFFNSITELKRSIYLRIAFWFEAAVFVLLMLLRVFAGVDLMGSFSRAIGLCVFSIFLLMAVIMIDNSRYCRRNGLPVRYRDYYPGLIVFFACILLDLAVYFSFRASGSGFGTFTRVGMLIFVLYSMIQFLGWWTRDHEQHMRDRLINQALQYATASSSVEQNIRSLLEYLGTELHSARLIVYEDQGNGKFRGTYEWMQNGLQTLHADLIYLPYEGFVDKLFRSFDAAGRGIIIRDPEELRGVHSGLYNMMMTNRDKTMVLGPLESGGKRGILVFVDTPEKLLEEAAEIISLISYFLAQLIFRREEEQRLRAFNYNDPLTGVQNRRAYMEFLDVGLDIGSPFGYLIARLCDYDDSYGSGGYETGDRMTLALAQCLTEVFGGEHVYRLGDAVFAAFGFETDAVYFDNDVERVRKMAVTRDLRISAGAVFCANGAMEIGRVIRYAEELMRDDSGR